ncbi:uncharacterized protein A4U43_C06F16230 [Asparagus officinalis]|uniref:Pentacotripeptide-repeat region of PRORP domain-containing protein n=1 Tax=Asparagus officinalis TaxID=4686 RepID=A0A5P1EPS1_ASPOF|nr:uncharacterized protein A4U43_C06F16230 [Asparagus officinalis]
MVEDAKKVLDEMGHLGFKPSGFEYRVVIQGYGRLGSFKEMRRVIGRMDDAKIGIDTICADLVLSCYEKVLEMLNDEEALPVKELADALVLLENWCGLIQKEEDANFYNRTVCTHYSCVVSPELLVTCHILLFS